jgi:hypothetical protein
MYPPWPAPVKLSLGATVHSSKATPPAALMASLIFRAISSRWLKQIATSDEELVIAIFGFSMSSSFKPKVSQ